MTNVNEHTDCKTTERSLGGQAPPDGVVSVLFEDVLDLYIVSYLDPVLTDKSFSMLV